MALSKDEITRYGRQIMLDGMGPEGQERLKSARVLIVGAGGLGSPLATYLAAAGVGRIILADSDVVDLSNLNRQILHWTSDLDRPKVESAAAKLIQLNNRIEVEPRRIRVDESNVSGLVAEVDLVLDALDNFDTRHLLNRACIEQGIPFIYGGIHSLTGMVTTIIPGRTACLACLFPGTIPAEVFPVLGTTPGVIATIQATEALKLLTEMGRPLANRLLIYNGLEMDFHEVETSPNPDCKVCHGNTEN